MCRRLAGKQFFAAVRRFCSRGHWFKSTRGLEPRLGLVSEESFMLKSRLIGMRVAIGFGLVVLLLVTIALSGYWGLEGVSAGPLKLLDGLVKVVGLAARRRTTTLKLSGYGEKTALNFDEKHTRT